jgi:cell wall-associated NlpC family hydrolase
MALSVGGLEKGTLIAAVIIVCAFLGGAIIAGGVGTGNKTDNGASSPEVADAGGVDGALIAQLDELMGASTSTERRLAIVGELRSRYTTSCRTFPQKDQEKAKELCAKLTTILDELERVTQSGDAAAIARLTTQLRKVIEDLFILTLGAGSEVAARATQIAMAMVEANRSTRALRYENYIVRISGTGEFDGRWRTDCSGYLGYVYQRATGRTIQFSTATSDVLLRKGFSSVRSQVLNGERSITRDNISRLVPGDMVVVPKRPGGRYGHVMMYIGRSDWAIVHSSPSSKAGGPSGAKYDTAQYLYNLTSQRGITDILRYTGQPS